MLNQSALSRLLPHKVIIIILISLVGVNCGKRSIPVPPVKRDFQRAEITGIQRGNNVYLFWKIPESNEFNSRFSKINRIDIYRLVESFTSSSTPLNEEEFASRSTLIATIPVSDSSPKQLSYLDNLEVSGQPTRLRYAIRFVNADGQKAVFSNFLLIEPTVLVANNPSSLSGKTSQNAIQLNWNAPASNINGSTPPNIIGYNVYRIVENGSAKSLNDAPIINNNFDDKFFEFGKKYKYFIRTISMGNAGEPIESLDSNTIEIRPEDIFAPISPSAITVAAAPNNLSIFFAVNPETDVAGYKIYRSTNPNQPKIAWTPLNNELLTTNTFQDKNVESGKTYYYYLTAVDKTGNVSEPSEIVSETAP
jgi:hypothetical protein